LIAEVQHLLKPRSAYSDPVLARRVKAALVEPAPQIVPAAGSGEAVTEPSLVPAEPAPESPPVTDVAA